MNCNFPFALNSSRDLIFSMYPYHFGQGDWPLSTKIVETEVRTGRLEVGVW